MLHRSNHYAAGWAIMLAVLSTSTAEAAKGIKKDGNGGHLVSGVVVGITADKTGYGTFEVRTAYNHKKLAAANAGGANGANADPSHLRKFNVTSTTKFEHHQGGLTTMVNAAALQRGHHVKVSYSGQHAEQVHIFTSMRTTGRRMNYNFMRHRPSAYYPHHYHHRRF